MDGHHCWHCVGWLHPSPVSQLRGSSPLNCPGWWPGWECGAVVKQSAIVEGCWMFSATCCCCCGRGTCIQMSHCRCCFPCIPTLASDITLSSPWVEIERAFYYRQVLPISAMVGVWHFFCCSVVKPYIICIFQHLPTCGGWRHHVAGWWQHAHSRLSSGGLSSVRGSMSLLRLCRFQLVGFPDADLPARRTHTAQPVIKFHLITTDLSTQQLV